jgi:hypothetical protein
MTTNLATGPWMIAVAVLAMACNGTESPNPAGTGGSPPGMGGATGGTTNPSGGSATGGTTNPSGGTPNASGGATPGTGGATGGTSSPSGGTATGGTSNATGGTSSPSGGKATGGASNASGGVSTGGKSTGGNATGGSVTDAGAVEGGYPDGCSMGTWPTADPTVAGPFATVTENNVGPTAGVGADGGPAPQFTMFRPSDLAQGGLCHPVITWGNGTGASPSMYGVLLRHLASHGFVVIASNSPNVAQGTPAPMVVGVTWVLAQNDDSTSVLYHRIDTSHVGATGHSQGAMATSQAAADSHITTCVPIEGAMVQRNLHGPAMFFCGGQDTLVGCSGAQSALDAVTTLPAMMAEYLSVDHGSWMSFMGTKPSVVEATVTAWMRVHLMGDTALRSWFYGASCKLCTDSGWVISRKNMDQ